MKDAVPKVCFTDRDNHGDYGDNGPATFGTSVSARALPVAPTEVDQQDFGTLAPAGVSPVAPTDESEQEVHKCDDVVSGDSEKMLGIAGFRSALRAFLEVSDSNVARAWRSVEGEVSSDRVNE